jgi:bifunctional UDP-N-acetylglucosamine pyrophosphorylase/glucosamine-1-phosphate N-acetyltransferase
MAAAMSNPIAAIILAAGKGTRMKSDLHKVLHPIAGRPMLLHLLDSFAALPPAATVVVVGDRREQIEAALAGTGASVAVQDPQLGTAHAALQAKGALAGFAGTVLACFGDCPMLTADTVRRLCAALDAGAKIAVLGFRPRDAAA